MTRVLARKKCPVCMKDSSVGSLFGWWLLNVLPVIASNFHRLDADGPSKKLAAKKILRVTS